MKIKILLVVGDSDLLVMQVRGEFVGKNDRLRKYKRVVLDSIELFDAFNIEVIDK